MKPSKIFSVLDTTRKAVQEHGKVLNPLFVGPPGLGKSEIVQQWCALNKMPFIDLRAAYLEAPDMVGFPFLSVVDGRQVTTHATPDFWPFAPESQGVIFLDEVNRGQTAVMNTFMQLLTDRRVHKYTLPKNWLIVGAVNPENGSHDVNTMDEALKNRFEMFTVDYDKQTFIKHMQDTGYESPIILFVDSGVWSYSDPEQIGDAPGAKYLSPRSFNKLDTLLKVGVAEEDQLMWFETILGANYGKAFYAFYHNEQPILYDDLVKHEKRALAKLKVFADPNNYKNGHIQITIKDIIEKKNIEDDLLEKVLITIPSDQGYQLLQGLQFARKDQGLLERMMKLPKIKEYFKGNLGEVTKHL